MLRRQIGRRIKNAALTSGWTAWHELWAARTYAFERLRVVGNRLRAPELELAFEAWASEWEAERRARERLAKRKRLDGLNGDRASLEAEVLRLREVAQTVEEERRERIALERQLIE